MIRESEAMASWARGTDYSGAACCAATRERGDYLLMIFGANLSRPFRDLSLWCWLNQHVRERRRTVLGYFRASLWDLREAAGHGTAGVGGNSEEPASESERYNFKGLRSKLRT